MQAESKNYLSENLAEVWRKITETAERVGRNPNEIKLVAVSKTHPVSVLQEAIKAGASVLGENKVQEAEDKISEIGRESAEWHLIGHLQSNKVQQWKENWKSVVRHWLIKRIHL